MYFIFIFQVSDVLYINQSLQSTVVVSNFYIYHKKNEGIPEKNFNIILIWLVHLFQNLIYFNAMSGTN